MKKVVFSLSFLFVWIAVQAQVDFVRNGEVVLNGTTLEIKELIDKGSGFGELNAELFVQNTGTEDVKAELTVTVLDGDPIAFCHFKDGLMGTCMVVNKDKSLSRTRTMKAGETHDPEIHSLAPIKLDDKSVKFYSIVEFSLSYGTTRKAVVVYFDYDASLISPIEPGLLSFVRKGKVIPDGTTLEIKELIDKGNGFGELNAELFVQNTGDEDVKAELTVTVLDGDPIAFCHFMDGLMGTCMVVHKDKSLSRTRTMKAGETHDPEIHSLAPIKLDDKSVKFYSIVEFKLVYGEQIQRVKVRFDCDPTEQEVQFIIWNQAELSYMNVGDSITLNAETTSGLEVQYEADSDIVQIKGNVLTALKAGVATVKAVQKGNDFYYPATSVLKSVTIGPATPKIQISDCIKTYDGELQSVSVQTVPSDLPYIINYYQGNMPVYDTSNADVYYVEVVVSTEDYRGSANSWLIVNKAPQVIVWEQEENLNVGDVAMLTALNSTSSLPVSFRSENQSIAQIVTVDGIPYIKGVKQGSVRIMAYVGGTDNYDEAYNVKTFIVGYATGSDSVPMESVNAEVSYYGSFIIVSSVSEGDRISLIDMNGRLLKSLSATNSTETIDVVDLDKGIYLVVVETKSGKATIKVVL